MEREAEDPDNSENLGPWLGSDGSQEPCVSESLVDSYYEDDPSDAEYTTDPQPGHSPERLQEWESTGEQQHLPELSGSEDDDSYQEEGYIYHSQSRESPHKQTSPAPASPRLGCPDTEPRSHSSSSSPGCPNDMTPALTLPRGQPQRANNSQGPETLNSGFDSSEEGGSHEAPPASVFFGILDEGAEQAETWNSESDTDLCRSDRHRARYTRISHSESQSERQAKENKSKCKRIARLLTDAPNPQNKGALLFRKRRQRVKKYTLVSYGTGDSEDQIEEETEEIRSAGYNFVATSESELDEEYSVQRQQRNRRVNWGSVRNMEALPDAKGKGVLMFAQRRKRIDEIVSEQEQLRSRGIPVETLSEPGLTKTQRVYDAQKMYDQAKYMDVNLEKQIEYQKNVQQVNNPSDMSRPLVSNRTAKPFAGFQDRTTGGAVPVSKKQELKFKVPVLTNTNTQIWFPTEDIIASRDERISVPAIKAGILPESKRRGSKQSSMLAQDMHSQSKGERRSYIESEEDCFSLGAEACNFMQPRTVRLKNPPPVAPKPAINPACPPWMRKSPCSEPIIPTRGLLSHPSKSSKGPRAQHYFQQQEWAEPRQMASHCSSQTWAALQTPAKTWAPISTSCQPPLQPTSHSWSQQPSQSPVSMHICSPTYSPHDPPSASKSKSGSAPHSVTSCPSKVSQVSLRGYVSDRCVNRTSNGPATEGREFIAKRQSRTQKHIVDAEGVQMDKTTKPPSPTSALPNYRRYSSNVCAPPPSSCNPLLTPFYNTLANKQSPSTSPSIKPKTKEKAKAQPDPVDITKHQPYHPDTSVFKYGEIPEDSGSKPSPASKSEAAERFKNESASSRSAKNASQSKAEVPSKSLVLLSSQNIPAHQNGKSDVPLATAAALHEKHNATLSYHHRSNKQTHGTHPASTFSHLPSTGHSIASAFSPASLIARGARQMAPRPKFCAKKPVVTGPQWRPVAMLH